MPCSDGGPSQEQIEHPHKVEALLCAVFHVLNVKNGPVPLHDVLNAVNWTKAGVTREWAQNWWQDHQERDRRREKEEAKQAEQVKLRHNARSKLTTQELAALGL